jgi:hypothetical protein
LIVFRNRQIKRPINVLLIAIGANSCATSHTSLTTGGGHTFMHLREHCELLRL